MEIMLLCMRILLFQNLPNQRWSRYVQIEVRRRLLQPWSKKRQMSKMLLYTEKNENFIALSKSPKSALIAICSNSSEMQVAPVLVKGAPAKTPEEK